MAEDAVEAPKAGARSVPELAESLRRRWLPVFGRLRRWSVVLLGVGTLVTLLCLILGTGALINDYKISKRTGRAVAEVQSVTFGRTLVRFNSADGAVHSPRLGTLYPSGLEPEQLVRVEYDTASPELVRVAGRGAWLALGPIGGVLAGTWLLVLGGVWWIQRSRSNPG